MAGLHTIRQAQPVEERPGGRRQTFPDAVTWILVRAEPGRFLTPSCLTESQTRGGTGEPSPDHRDIQDGHPVNVPRGQFGKSPMDGLQWNRNSMLSRPTSTNISSGIDAGLLGSVGPRRFTTKPMRSHRVIMLVMPSQ